MGLRLPPAHQRESCDKRGKRENTAVPTIPRARSSGTRHQSLTPPRVGKRRDYAPRTRPGGETATRFYLPRALDPAEKQPQDFTHSAVVQFLFFGSDATESENTELQRGRKIKRKKGPGSFSSRAKQ
jgi:hypothetical protein